MSSLHAPHTETQMGCNTSHSVNISQFLWLIAGNLGDKRFHSMRYRGPQRRRIGEGSSWWHFTPCLADKSWNLINSICIFIKTNMEGNVNPRGTLRNAIEKKIFHSVASHSRHTKWNSRKQVSYSFHIAPINHPDGKTQREEIIKSCECRVWESLYSSKVIHLKSRWMDQHQEQYAISL